MAKGTRWWVCYVIGGFALLALLGAAIVIIGTQFLGWNFGIDQSSPYVKVRTPVGSDFFSVQFSQSRSVSGAYIIPIQVGKTNPTTVKMLIDSGSADTWIDSSTGFTASSSFVPHSNQRYSISYIGGTVAGNLGEDQLSINSFKWNQKFGVVSSESMQTTDLDGIIGVSLGGCDGRHICSLANWPLNQSVLGFYYDPSNWAGLFMAGFVNETEYCSSGTSLTWLNLTASYYWMGRVGMTVNGKSLGSNLVAVFDTGTTYFMMSQSLYDRMNAIIQTNGGCTNPTITLMISGVEFTIPSSVLLRSRVGGCKLRTGVVGSNGVSQDLLVGATFLVNFYSVFDLAQQRIGFCPAKVGLTTHSRRLGEDSSDSISRLLDVPSRMYGTPRH